MAGSVPFSRRRLIGWMAGTAMTLGLAACTPGAAPTTAPAPAQPAPTAKPGETAKPAAPAAPAGTPGAVEFMTRGGEYILNVTKMQVEAFNKEYPTVKINIDMTTGNHFEKLQLRIAGGNPPDVYFDAMRTQGLAVRKGIAVDLEPYLRAEKTFNPDEFIKSAWLCQLYDHKRYGLPWDSGAMFLAYNIDLFNKAGVPLPDPKKRMTWDEVLEIGRKLTLDFSGKHPGDPGFDAKQIKQYGFMPSTMHGHEGWIYTNGGEIIAEDGSVPIDSPEAIEGYQLLADFGVKYYVAPSLEFQQSQPMTFQAGTVAMAHDGVWMLGRTNEAGVKWGIAPFPVRKTPVSYGQYSGLVMTTMSKNKDQAWQWQWWACMSSNGQKILVDTGQQQPVRKDLQSYFVDNPNPPAKEYRQVAVDELDEKTVRWPGDKSGSFYLGWRQPWIDFWGPVYDPVLRGRKQFKEIAKETRQKLEQLLKAGEVS